MISIRLEHPVKASAEAVWALVGDFGALADWHPMVPNCSLSDDGLKRTIAIPGMDAIEVMDPDATTDLSHSYTIEQSPMPLTNYRATVGVIPKDDDGCTLFYESTCEAVGAPDRKLKAALENFFTTGFSAVSERLE
jgi:hypothetical protein